jgi:cell division cycle protein 37
MKMPEEEAKYHMKRCVDSGLWVPEAGAKETEEEPIYQEAESAASKSDDLDLD